MDITKKFNHISLCTGYGGIDLGLARTISNLRTISFCEIELYAIQNLVTKMEKGWLHPSPVWTDLKTFPFKDFYGKVDIISGGFPCQPFSTSGRRNGDTDPRHLFPYIKQGCEDSKPAFIFLENVRGIITSTLNTEEMADPKGTPVLLHILREMERIGYQCEWGLFSARETGLPHTRHRVFILGKRNDITHSQLSTFFEYFQKDDVQTQSNETQPKVKFQVIGENDYGVEKIKSRLIAIPKHRDKFQYAYEPRRIIGRKDLDNTLGVGLETTNIKEWVSIKNEEWEAVSEYTPSDDRGDGLATQHEKKLSDKPPMVRNANGIADWLDNEKLFNDYTDHRGEMTLLGNGVVPAMAEIAFRTLFDKIKR